MSLKAANEGEWRFKPVDRLDKHTENIRYKRSAANEISKKQHENKVKFADRSTSLYVAIRWREAGPAQGCGDWRAIALT